MTKQRDSAPSASTLTQLGRIDEVRAELSRGHEAYAHVTEKASRRLSGLAATRDAEVAKAAKDVASEYDVDLVAGGLKQPPAPKRHSPFAD